MSAMNLMILILPRELTDGYTLFLRDAGVRTDFSFPCSGTASPGMLARMGLERNEKTLILFMTERAGGNRLMRRCVTDMGLNMPGNGIAMTVPVEAVGGISALRLLSENMTEADGVKRMNRDERFPCSLIVAICENGHSDEVMDAARSAGARGGTVVHAKGPAGELAQKFMGVSLVSEKEMILILTNQEKRDSILRAVMDQAGLQSAAHAVLFTLPVEKVAGLRSVMEEKTEEDKEKET